MFDIYYVRCRAKNHRDLKSTRPQKFDINIEFKTTFLVSRLAYAYAIIFPYLMLVSIHSATYSTQNLICHCFPQKLSYFPATLMRVLNC